LRWSGEGEFLGKVDIFDPVNTDTENGISAYATDLQWFPPPPGKGQVAADTYVVGATDGRLSIFSSNDT
jgi:hypothetical protein